MERSLVFLSLPGDYRVVGGCQYCQYPPRYAHFKIGRSSSFDDRGKPNVYYWTVARNTILPPRVMLGAITSCLVTVLCVVAQPVDAEQDASEMSSESSTGVSVSQTTSPVIVVGFLGGFVAHDEPHHPEVQLIRDLHQEYPEHVYFGLFENSKVGEAYRSILNQLGATGNQELSDAEKRRAHILLFGHSWGASAVIVLSRKLERTGIPVMLTVQVDSVAKPFQNDRVIPPNVFEAANFYQTRGLIHGRSRITSADPSRTTILGNFRWEYKEEPAECRDFSWYARFFTKSHIEIECDPEVWSQVKTLVRRRLPDPQLTRGAENGHQTLNARELENAEPRRNLPPE
jgi:hypothetical protein